MTNIAVNFQHFKFYDHTPPLSLEETFRLFGSWSNIHKFVFDKMLNQSSLTVTGITSGQWTTQNIPVANLPSSFEIRYHKTVYEQALGFLINGGVYIVGTDSSGYPFASYGTSLIEKVPRVTPQEADVVIVFRQQQFENDASSGTSPTAQNLVWYSVSIYMNDALIYSFIISSQATSTLNGIYFCAYGMNTVTYSNILIPDLPETAEFGTLDQGESPMGGLQRTIEGRYLRFFIRYDGSLRVFRTKAVASSETLLNEEFYVTSLISNLTDLATHIRMVGAYIWSEYFDPALSQLYGHRFREINNPMLITEGECETEAQRTIVRSQESVFQEQANMPFLPLIEPEDRIITPDGDWLMTDTQYTFEDGGSSSMNVVVRKYGWGS